VKVCTEKRLDYSSSDETFFLGTFDEVKDVTGVSGMRVTGFGRSTGTPKVLCVGSAQCKDGRIVQLPADLSSVSDIKAAVNCFTNDDPSALKKPEISVLQKLKGFAQLVCSTEFHAVSKPLNSLRSFSSSSGVKSFLMLNICR